MSGSVSPTVRRFAAVLAVLGWTALLAQIPFSIERSLGEGRTVIGGVVRYFSFFTIQTNVLVSLAVVVTWLAPRSRLGAFVQRPRVVTALAAYIVLVGAAYHLLLSALYNPTGIPWVTDVVFHYVMPLGFVAYWWLAVPRGTACWPGGALAAFPLAYFLFLLARGQLTGDYLYPFMDLPKLGFGVTLLFGLALLAALFVVALLLTALRSGRGNVTPNISQ